MYREYDLSSRCRKLLPDHSYERPRDQIRRSRFEPNLREHHGSASLRSLLVFLYHIIHVGNFSSDVKVMCAILRASFEGMFSVQSVRPDSADENLCLLGQSTQVCIVQFADFDICGVSDVSSQDPLFSRDTMYG